MPDRTISITALQGIPRVQPGDDLAVLLTAAIERSGAVLQAGDFLVVAQKIVSKSEGRYVDLAGISPSPRAVELANITRKDPYLVEVILSQSVAVLRARPHVLIVETRSGLIMANAGVDQSNLDPADAGRRVLLLPENADASAERLRERIAERFGPGIGVVISDSVGRPWRLGTVGLAIGAAGIASLWDRRGEPDLNGRALEVTEVGLADAVASAGVLAMGEAAEGCPAAVVRGIACQAGERPASSLVRPRSQDLFR